MFIHLPSIACLHALRHLAGISDINMYDFTTKLRKKHIDTQQIIRKFIIFADKVAENANQVPSLGRTLLAMKRTFNSAKL